jgi:hypothetical protein
MYLTDGSDDAPKMAVYLNTDTLVDLNERSVWPGGDGNDALERLRLDGFAGVQVGGALTLYNGDILPFCGLDRVSIPGDADAVFERHALRGDQCISLHVGWGMESDQEIDLLVESVLEASGRYQLPAFIETHRATITQDMWRTVELTKRFPEMRFNGDFSHWYCGQEMAYGDFESKLNFLQPVFDRVGFLHGRIASPGNMQVPIESSSARPLHAGGEADYLADFKMLWKRAMAGFQNNAPSGSVLVFAPEILTNYYYYARMVPGADGVLEEEVDRYAQALLYREIAEDCFETCLTRPVAPFQ